MGNSKKIKTLKKKLHNKYKYTMNPIPYPLGTK